MTRALGLALSALLLFCGTNQVQALQLSGVPEKVVHYPELIVHNAKVVTMDDKSISTTSGTIVEAMAIREGKVLALGSNAEILSLAGPKTQKINAGGRTVIPGIVNSHTHIHNGAVNTWAAENPAQAASVVRAIRVAGTDFDELKRNLKVTLLERLPSVPDGTTVYINLPSNLMAFEFVKKLHVTRTDLDQWAPNHPLMLNSSSGGLMINSRFDEKIKEIYGYLPTEEYRSKVTGYCPKCYEFRRAVVTDGYFKDKLELLAGYIAGEQAKQVASGVTTYSSHLYGLQNLNAVLKLSREGRLPIRFGFGHYTGFQVNPNSKDFYNRLGDLTGWGNDYLWNTGVAAANFDHIPPMICTSVDAAKFKWREWCRNAPGTEFANDLYAVVASGARMAVGHNNGDLGLDYFLDMLQKAIDNEPNIDLEHIRSKRMTLDHCGLYPRPDQIPRLKHYGIMLSCGTPSDSAYDMIQEYGQQYAAWAAPIKSLLAGGVKVSFEGEGGSEGGLFHSMVPYITRKTGRGNLLAPEEAVDRVTVMKMATNWSAEFVLREDVLGSLEPGKFGDFLILNKDYFTVPVEEIGTVYPLMTVIGGKIGFLRDEFAAELGMQPAGFQLRYNFETGNR